jgi:hypothetical protein
MTQKFIQFVMMQAQQAALYLGQIPHPQTGKAEVNLEVARMFIDQLEMIHEKTRGNLSSEESKILTGVLSDLQLAFVQSAGGAPLSEEPAAPEASPAPKVVAAHADEPAAAEAESRKKFTKSYGS